MDFDQFPLRAFEVDCDGSACSSTDVGRHIHPPDLLWFETEAIARVRIIRGQRAGYTPAKGISELVMVDETA